MNIDDLTAKYIELRDRKAAIKKEAEKAGADITKMQDAIENRIKLLMHEHGVTSFKTPHGTAYIAYEESATVADWDAVLRFVEENDAYDLLEKRVSKSAVRDRMEEDRHGNYVNPPPPGVNFTRMEGVNVRRA